MVEATRSQAIEATCLLGERGCCLVKVDANSNEAYVINLDQDIERLAHAKQQHPSVRRWPGVVVSGARDLRRYARFFREDFDFVPQDLQLGNFGCTLSHLTLLEHVQRSERNVIFVFEDDFVLNRPFSDLINAVNSFPPDWDLINLAAWGRESLSEELISYESHTYSRVLGGKMCGAFALAFKTVAIPKILELARADFGAGGGRGGTRFADTLFMRIAPGIRYYYLDRGRFVDHSEAFSSSRCEINVGGLFARIIRKVRRSLRG